MVFVIASLAVATWLVRKGEPYIGGLAFALCAAKFHLFLLVPLWIVAQKRWRFGQGFATGATAMAIVSFAAGGQAWPARYYRMLSDPAVNSSPDSMPNIHGLVSGMSHSVALEAAGTVFIAVLACWSFRRLNFECGLAMVLAAGILIGHHAYLADCALLIPGALMVLTAPNASPARLLAVVLLAPFTYIGMWLGPPAAFLTPAVVLAFVVILAWVAWRGDIGERARVVPADVAAERRAVVE